jgi:hypothetical protein
MRNGEERKRGNGNGNGGNQQQQCAAGARRPLSDPPALDPLDRRCWRIATSRRMARNDTPDKPNQMIAIVRRYSGYGCITGSFSAPAS